MPKKGNSIRRGWIYNHSVRCKISVRLHQQEANQMKKIALISIISIIVLMTFWDASLHFVELFHLERFHPLFPHFPSMHFYQVFWTIFWSSAFVLSSILLIMIFMVPLARKIHGTTTSKRFINHKRLSKTREKAWTKNFRH